MQVTVVFYFQDGVLLLGATGTATLFSHQCHLCRSVSAFPNEPGSFDRDTCRNTTASLSLWNTLANSLDSVPLFHVTKRIFRDSACIFSCVHGLPWHGSACPLITGIRLLHTVWRRCPIRAIFTFIGLYRSNCHPTAQPRKECLCQSLVRYPAGAPTCSWVWLEPKRGRWAPNSYWYSWRIKSVRGTTMVVVLR